MTGRPAKAADVHLEPLPEVSELLNLEEMAVDDCLADLKTGEIAEVVLLKPETTLEELTFSSVLGEDALEEMKKRREARLGSEVLNGVSFGEGVCGRGIQGSNSHQIEEFGTRSISCLAQSIVSPLNGFCLESSARSSMSSLPRRQRQAWYGNRNPRTRRQPSAFGNRTGSGVWFTVTTS
ncbi:hypothetical protein PI125_g25432 [Phytophthora idaei]|nr:hypothetical protein PI125_g25432 [Phytophthora idaei]KAG3124238.1 hypothetical protein PI126_g23341 [Phytophthora idaei]